MANDRLYIINNRRRNAVMLAKTYSYISYVTTKNINRNMDEFFKDFGLSSDTDDLEIVREEFVPEDYKIFNG